MNDRKTVEDTLLCPKVIDDDSGDREHDDVLTNTIPIPYQFGRRDTLIVIGTIAIGLIGMTLLAWSELRWMVSI